MACHHLHCTDILQPADVVDDVDRRSRRAKRHKTQHPSAADGLRGIARKALYIRAHWLRMPPHLLAYHLAHKALFPPKADTRNLTAGENTPA